MSNTDFVLAINEWVDKVEGSFDSFVKRVVFEIYVDIVMMTPVDTGRLRANYQIGVNTRPGGVVTTFKAVAAGEKGSSKKKTVKAARSGSEGVGEAVARGMEGMKAVTWGTIVYIVNNLPYAMSIEMGHSKQAPEGMARIAVRKMANRLKSAGGA